MKILLRTSLVLLMVVVSACTSYSGLRPIYPDVGHPVYHVVDVGTLQPTLQWAVSPEKEITYDLVIYEGPESLFGYLGGELTVVYSRERLTKPEHKLEEPLKPGKIYFWSVRTRNGSGVSQWSRYNYHQFALIYYYWANDQLYRFRTPEEQK